MRDADPQCCGCAGRNCQSDQKIKTIVEKLSSNLSRNPFSRVQQEPIVFVLLPAESLDHANGAEHFLDHGHRSAVEFPDLLTLAAQSVPKGPGQDEKNGR